MRVSVIIMKRNILIQDIASPRTQRVTKRTATPSLPNVVNINNFSTAKSNSPEYAKSKKKYRKYLVVLLMIPMLVSIFWGYNAYADKAPAQAPAFAVVENIIKSSTPAPKIYTATMQSNIEKIIAQYPELQISVAYKDIVSKSKVTIGVQDPYKAASTAKILTAVMFLLKVEKGEYRLDEKIGNKLASTQLELMIRESDNDAWTAFNDLLTRKELELFGSRIGMTSYRSEDHLSTSSDILLLLEKLYTQELLNKAHTDLILNHMKNASDTQYIRSAVPESISVFHKSGYLKDRAHDSAIVAYNNRPFILVIFSKTNNSGDYDYEKGARVMKDITSSILTQYTSNQ